MESNIFIYISMAEGVMICVLLAWEIFWLSRMYKVLWNMPTAKQVESMVKVIKEDGEKITKVVDTIGVLADGLTKMFSLNPLSSNRVKKGKYEYDEEESLP